MLTNSRCNKIKEMLDKDNYYKLTCKDFRINCSINNDDNWSCGHAYNYTELNIKPTFNHNIFNIDYLDFLVNEYGLDRDYVNYDYDNTVTLVVLLHEYGHSHRYNNMSQDEYYNSRMNTQFEYDLLKERMRELFNKGEYNPIKHEIEYRRLDNEAYADRIAVEIVNKYGIQLLSIIKGISQKQIRLELSRRNRG